MKKILLTLSLCIGILLGCNSQSVQAKELKETKNTVEFKEGGNDNTSNPNPDPIDLSKPNPDPDIGSEAQPGRQGSLRFTSLPTINFGQVTLPSKNGVYFSLFEYRTAKIHTKDDKDTKFEYPTFFTVEDVRGGNKGWEVQVQHNGEFVNSNPNARGTETEKLKGSLSLRNATIKTETFLPENGLETYKPKTLIANTNEYISVSGGEPITLAKAKEGTGYGKWSIAYGTTTKKIAGTGINGTPSSEGEIRNPAVRIDVPKQIIGTNYKDKYIGTLNWELLTVK